MSDKTEEPSAIVPPRPTTTAETDERGAELAQATRQATEWFGAVLDASPLATYVVGRDGIVLIWNPAAETIFGWSSLEVIGGRLPHIPSEGRDEFDLLFARALAGDPFCGAGVQQVRKDGQTIAVRLSMAPLADASGEAIAVMVTAEDVSDSVAAVRTRTEVEQKFAALANSSADAIVSTDAHGRITFWNRSAERMFGYSAREIIGESLTILMPDRFRAQQAAAMRTTGGSEASRFDGRTVEFRGLTRSGAEVPTEVSFASWTSGGETFHGAIIRDVSERKRAETALRHRVETERLISNVSARFNSLTPERLDEGINGALHMVAGYFGVDRGFVLLFDEHGLGTASHCWRRADDDASADTERFLHAHLSSSLRNLPRDEIVLASVSDLDSDDAVRWDLETHGLSTILGVPIALGPRRLGALGFCTFRSTRDWPEPDVRVARLVAELIAGALARKAAYDELRSVNLHLEGSVARRTEQLEAANIALQDEVSQRERAEGALRESERHFRNIFENVPIGLYRSTPAGRFISANPCLLRMLDYDSVGDLAALDLERGDVCSVSERRAFRERLEVAGEILGLDGEWRRRDGATIAVRENARIVRDDRGGVLYYEGSVENIGDRLEAEHALRESEMRYRSVVDNVKEVIFQTDASGAWTFLNPAWTEITGFGMDESLGECFLDFVHPDDRVVNAERFAPLIAREKDYCRHQIRYLTKDGGFRWVEVFARLTIAEDDRIVGTSGTLTDVTERRLTADALQKAKEELELKVRERTHELYDANARLSAELEQRSRVERELQSERSLLAEHVRERTSDLSRANAELARASRLKDEFLASMSHELRTPLNAVLGLSEALNEGVFGPLNEKQQKALRNVEESGRHLLSLINDILDLSKIEAGKLTLDLTSVRVEQLCQASLRLVKQTAQKKHLKVQCSVDEQIATLRADERRLKQMLVNLLSNSVKFTPDGGSIGLDVTCDRVAGSVRFTVWDTGVGISEEDIAKLFKPFVQLDSRLARQHPGTGLGLALVYRMAQMHGGSVSLESEVGTGSRFTVSLPWFTGSRASRDSSDAALEQAGSPGVRGVLIVDDASTGFTQTERYLDELGIAVSTHPGGECIVSRVVETRPDLVLLDVDAQSDLRWDVLRELKSDARTRAVPIVVVSTNDERERALEAGAADSIVRPMTRERLTTALYRAHEQNARPSPIAAATAAADPEASALILLAEDNEINIATVSPFLRRRGYRIILAQDGESAVRRAVEDRPDLILMDVQMPGMDGLEATRRIRANEDTARIPIVALTALAMPGDRERCVEAGVDEYLSKPVQFKQLFAIIELHLSRAGGAPS